MAYYQFPFNHEVFDESLQSNGDLLIRHRHCALHLQSQLLGDELIQSHFSGDFAAPVQLDTSDQAESDLVTFMLNMGSAVCYQIDGLGVSRILPTQGLGLCYSSARAGYCRYQHSSTKLFSLQLPRQLFADYLDVMHLDDQFQRQVQNAEPFMLIRPATDTLVRMAQRLSESAPESALHRHLAHAFICDGARYLLDASHQPARRDNHDGLEQALQILDRQYATPPTITQLAHQVGTNETSLKHWFRDALDTTVRQYIQQRRMCHAMQLLEQGQQPVAWIAQEVGYSNHGHFAAAFKKQAGCSPSEYQRRFQ